MLSIIKKKQKEFQKKRKTQNMRDLQNRRKVKDIGKRRRNIEEKVIKNHLDALDMLN